MSASGIPTGAFDRHVGTQLTKQPVTSRLYRRLLVEAKWGGRMDLQLSSTRFRQLMQISAREADAES